MEEPAELRRDLGFWGALTIGAGTMIGAGIFLLAGLALEQAGPAAVLSYLVAGLVCLLTAASAAELATGMPTSGGDYYFVSRSLGPAFGAISGVGIWLSLTVAIAFYLVGTGEFLTQVSPLDPTVGALIATALLLVLNVVGAKVSGSAQVVIVLALVGILGVFVVGGLTEVETANLSPFVPEGGGAVLSTTALVFVSFLGFVKIAAVAEEIKDPAKNLPRTLMGSVALVTLLYVLIVLIIAGIFTQETIREVPDPLTRAARLVYGSAGAQAIIIAGLFATLSSANASILAASRINLAMSRDRLFPRSLATINQRTVTPVRAILLTSSLAALLIVLLPNVEELAKIASSLQLYSYAAINVGAVALRAADPEWYRPTFRVPLSPYLQVIAALGCLSIIGFSGVAAQAAVVGLILLSLLWYALVRAGGEIDIEHAVPQLQARWAQLGLRALFAPPSAADVPADDATSVAPIERISGPDDPRHVVVALGNPRTERALLRAGRWIATGRDAGGEVDGVHLEVVPRQTPLGASDLRADETRQTLQRLDSVLEELDASSANGRPVSDTALRTSVDLVHDVSTSLVRETTGRGGDLLLLGWQGGFSLGRIARSPVRHVIAELPADLAVLRNRGLSDIRRILVPWGGGRHARLGLEVAVRIAGATGARIDLLRIVTPDFDAGREREAVLRQVDDIVDDTEVDVLVETADDVIATITSVVERDGHELVVIGASGETRIRSVLFGTIPDVVADSVGCSVMLVRRYLPKHWAYRASDRMKRFKERLGVGSSPPSSADGAAPS